MTESEQARPNVDMPPFLCELELVCEEMHSVLKLQNDPQNQVMQYSVTWVERYAAPFYDVNIVVNEFTNTPVMAGTKATKKVWVMGFGMRRPVTIGHSLSAELKIGQIDIECMVVPTTVLMLYPEQPMKTFVEAMMQPIEGKNGN